MKTLRILLLILLCCAGSSNAQNLVLVRGQAKADAKIIPAGTTLKLAGVTRLELLKGARALVYTGGRKLELYASETTHYTVKQLQGQLDKLKDNLGRFDGFIESTYSDARRHDARVGKVSGGSEGLDQKRADIQKRDNGDKLSPVDSAVVLGKSVKLEWELKKALVKPKLLVTNLGTGGITAEQNIGQKGEFVLELLSEGTYQWKIQSQLEKKTVIGGLIFKKSEAETAALQKQLGTFKDEVSDLSPEMQYLLLSDYKLQHKISEP